MKTKRIRIALCVFMLIAVLTFGISKVQADMAPPAQPTGANVIPGEERTQVRMVAEEVIIEVQPDLLPAESNEWGVQDWAKVTASFDMYNTGTLTEKMDARFPLMNPSGFGDGYGNQPEVKDFKVVVEDQTVHHTILTTDNPSGFDETPIKWATFPVTFKALQNVHITVTYSVKATGYPPFAEFGYILETGAGWKDTIGKGKIIIRLPYDVSAQNFLVENDDKPYIFSGNDAVYTFSDLEPDQASNIHVSLLEPVIWSQVLDGRQRVKANPSDAQAWAALAEGLRLSITQPKGWLREDNGGIELYSECLAAYEKVNQLDPAGFDGHIGLGRLIWSYMSFRTDIDKQIIQNMLVEYATAYSIDPNNEELVTELGWISSSFPDWIIGDEAGFTFPTVSEEAILENKKPALVLNQPTAAEKATEVPVIPTRIITEGVIAEKRGSGFSCCSSIALPLAGVIGVGFLHFRRKKEY